MHDPLVHAPRCFSRRTPTAMLLLASGDAPQLLRGTALDIWDSFAAPTTVARATEALASAYGVEQVVIARDVEHVVESLVADGLLVRAAP